MLMIRLHGSMSRPIDIVQWTDEFKKKKKKKKKKRERGGWREKEKEERT